MRRSKKEKKTIVIDKTVDILCNKCGKSVIDDGEIYWTEGCAIKIEFGYGSSKDGEIHEFDICDSCYDEFVGTFKHSNIIKGRL